VITLGEFLVLAGHAALGTGGRSLAEDQQAFVAQQASLLIGKPIAELDLIYGWGRTDLGGGVEA
jgi:hypothetical protein